MKRNPLLKSSEKGSALVVTAIYVTILGLLIATILDFAGGENVQIQRRTSREISLYGAEAAVQRTMSQIRSLMTTSYPMSGYISGYAAPTTSELSALSSPSSVATFQSDYSFSGVAATYTSGSSTNHFVQHTIPSTSTDPYAGLQTSRATILCSASATVGSRFSVKETVNQELFVDYVPIFQYAIFYNMDMEAFNGPDMTINGKVHANGNFYYNPFGNLTISDNLTISGDLIHGLKTWSSSKNDWVAGNPTWNSGQGSFKVKDPTSGSLPDAKSGTSPVTYYDSTATDWSTGAYTKWHGGVKDESLGVEDVVPPLPTDVLSSATDPNNPYHVMIEAPVMTSSGAATWSVADNQSAQNAKMAFSASLIIHRSGTNVYFSVPIKDGSGKVTAFKDINIKNKSTIVPSATTTVRDQREYLDDSNKITMSEFSLEKLYGAIDSSGYFIDNATGTAVAYSTVGVSDPISSPKFNGIVYIYDDNYNGATGTGRHPGIRINDKPTSGNSATINASLPSGVSGISIISENPVYVFGNFNSDGNVGTAPEGNNANSGSASSPKLETSGTTSGAVKNAMIVGDAVSFMSKDWQKGGSGTWDDDSSLSTLWSRRSTTSTTTEVNAAIIAGASNSDPTSTLSDGDGTTGGIHNYPRFMEQWNGKNFKISGSMASLFFSKQSASYFVDSGSTGKVYGAPTRVYAFNTQYLNMNNLPPGTPIVRRFASGVWTN